MWNPFEKHPTNPIAAELVDTLVEQGKHADSLGLRPEAIYEKIEFESLEDEMVAHFVFLAAASALNRRGWGVESTGRDESGKELSKPSAHKKFTFRDPAVRDFIGYNDAIKGLGEKAAQKLGGTRKRPVRVAGEILFGVDEAKGARDVSSRLPYEFNRAFLLGEVDYLDLSALLVERRLKLMPDDTTLPILQAGAFAVHAAGGEEAPGIYTINRTLDPEADVVTGLLKLISPPSREDSRSGEDFLADLLAFCAATGMSPRRINDTEENIKVMLRRYVSKHCETDEKEKYTSYLQFLYK